MPPLLPAELVNEILGHAVPPFGHHEHDLRLRQQVCARLSLVCKAWTPFAQRKLFRFIEISIKGDEGARMKTARRIHEAQRHGRLVRGLVLRHTGVKAGESKQYDIVTEHCRGVRHIILHGHGHFPLDASYFPSLTAVEIVCQPSRHQQHFNPQHLPNSLTSLLLSGVHLTRALPPSSTLRSFAVCHSCKHITPRLCDFPALDLLVWRRNDVAVTTILEFASPTLLHLHVERRHSPSGTSAGLGAPELPDCAAALLRALQARPTLLASLRIDCRVDPTRQRTLSVRGFDLVHREQGGGKLERWCAARGVKLALAVQFAGREKQEQKRSRG